MTKINAEEIIEIAEKESAHIFNEIDKTESVNTERILNAFAEERVSAACFSPSNGYGYDDMGRDKLEGVFAKALFCESAIVRAHIASGTHAIYIALDGLLRYGDNIIFASGEPYDTLLSAIKNKNSFAANGVDVKIVELNPDNSINTEKVLELMDDKTKIVYVQRSRGYAWRDAILPEDMEELFSTIHKKYPSCVTVVDNCYGEFTRKTEPSCFGADVLIGSLIKNPGGGLAPTGGYIAGKEKYIEIIADRLTVPGMGREVGSYAASYRPLYQGLFMAPHTVAQALKTVVLFARAFEILGFESVPSFDSVRSDIVQAIKFNTADELIEFCISIQAVSPVDSFAAPEPGDMPGYDDKVIMAAGTFVQGASVELTADGPVREPYTAYMQGALTYAHGKIAARRAINSLIGGKQ